MKDNLNKVLEIMNTLKPLTERAEIERALWRNTYDQARKESHHIVAKHRRGELSEAEMEEADKRLDAIDEKYEDACDKAYCLEDIMTKLAEAAELMEQYMENIGA